MLRRSACIDLGRMAAALHLESGPQEWWGPRGICCAVFRLAVMSSWFLETTEGLPWPPPTPRGASVLLSEWGSAGL